MKYRGRELYFPQETALDIDVRVHMLYGRQAGDIIWQYITFCKVLTAQIKIHGKTRTAIEETDLAHLQGQITRGLLCAVWVGRYL